MNDEMIHLATFQCDTIGYPFSDETERNSTHIIIVGRIYTHFSLPFPTTVLALTTSSSYFEQCHSHKAEDPRWPSTYLYKKEDANRVTSSPPSPYP